MSNGARVGQFSAEASWDIKTLNSPANRRKYRARYVPDWFRNKRESWKKFVSAKIDAAKKDGRINEDENFKLHSLRNLDEDRMR